MEAPYSAAPRLARDFFKYGGWPCLVTNPAVRPSSVVAFGVSDGDDGVAATKAASCLSFRLVADCMVATNPACANEPADAADDGDETPIPADADLPADATFLGDVQHVPAPAKMQADATHDGEEANKPASAKLQADAVFEDDDEGIQATQNLNTLVVELTPSPQSLAILQPRMSWKPLLYNNIREDDATQTTKGKANNVPGSDSDVFPLVTAEIQASSSSPTTVTPSTTSSSTCLLLPHPFHLADPRESRELLGVLQQPHCCHHCGQTPDCGLLFKTTFGLSWLRGRNKAEAVQPRVSNAHVPDYADFVDKSQRRTYRPTCKMKGAAWDILVQR